VRIAPCGCDICATNLLDPAIPARAKRPATCLVMSLQTQIRPIRCPASAYDKKRDRTYSITVQVSDGALLTRGCILGGVLCRNVRWKSAQ
jgi:uncharacterized protein (DUF2147 family)